MLRAFDECFATLRTSTESGTESGAEESIDWVQYYMQTKAIFKLIVCDKTLLYIEYFQKLRFSSDF